MLAIGGTTATAQAPAKKVSSGTSAFATVATAAPAQQTQRVQFKTTRSASPAVSVFSAAATGRVAPHRTPAAHASGAAIPNMNGLVVYAENWGETNNTNYAELPASDGAEFTQLFPVPETNGTVYSATMVDGTLYTSEYENFMGFIQFFYFNAYDGETGEQLVSYDSETPDVVMFGMATDPTSGTVYGIGFNAAADGYQISTLTLGGEQPGITPVAPFEAPVSSIAFDSNGQMWAIAGTTDAEGNTVDACLLKVDKATGAYEIVGDLLGFAPVYISGGTIDPATNKYYFHSSEDTGGFLYDIDLATATATLVCTFPYGEEVVGIEMAPVVAPGTPGKVENLVPSFPEGSLSGTVSFDVPAVENATTVSYTIYANGAEVATGSTAAPGHVDAAVTVAAPGSYKLGVKLANGELAGKTATVTVFIGNGVPAAPANVTAAYANGTMTLTWDAVTTSADGGYINPAGVTYTVVRNPDAVTVAEGLAATTFSEPLQIPDSQIRYSYDVTATYAGVAGPAGTSNVVALGEIGVPYTNDFADQDVFDQMTVIDANDDGKTWSFYQGAARYRYSTSNSADDWLMTPALTVEAGKAYPFSLKVKANSSTFPERFEVYYGNAQTVEAMTTCVIEPTTVATNQYVEYTALIPAPAGGKLVVGIHAISDADKYDLFVDDINIGEGVSALAPGAATDIVIASDPDGAFKTTITCKAPATTLNGQPLTGNVDMVIKRGETPVFDQSVAPGADINFVDEIADMTESGNVTYTFAGANAEGMGSVVSKTVFVGIDYPAAPQNVAFTEPTPGTVTISWDAVTTDQNGNAINPALVRYNVYTFSGSSRTPIAENVTETSYTYQAMPEGEQDFMQFAVFAVTSRGEGEGNLTDMNAVGTPYEGLAESFPNATLSYPVMMRRLAGSTIKWGLYKDDSGIPSQDGDNGFIGSQGQYLEEASALVLPKVSLAGMVNPGVSFYTYNLIGESGNPDENIVEIGVREVGAQEFTTIFNKTVVEICGTGVEGWGKVSASLEAYAGKTIQIQIVTTIKGYANTLVDNIKIGSQLAKDLKAHRITAPATVPVDMDYMVQVTVANEGMEAAAAYSVELYADGEKIATKEATNLASGSTKNFNFSRHMHILAEEPTAYHAVVVFEGDENAANNTLEAVSVAPKVSKLPKVTDLTGAEVAEGVKLTWSEPNLESVPEVKTESFEEGTAFATEFEGWTFVDVDGGKVGGFQNTDIPGITPGESTGSFFVFEQSDAYPQFNLSFAAHEGNKYLACLFNYDDSQIDDWAITPELTGNAQTITFYARSYQGQYAEKISLYYSTTGTAISDFLPIEGKTDMVVSDGGDTREYTLYEANVPEGAKYFAIRSHAAGSFMLLVDDVTFEAAGATASLSIVGYDIYRNGEKINAEPTGETEYIDANPLENAEYRVVVNYNKGASAGSNAVTVQYSGVEGIGAANISISAANSAIVVRGAEGQQIVVNAVDGRTIFAGAGSATTRVAVVPGVYVVKAGNKVAKVAVR